MTMSYKLTPLPAQGGSKKEPEEEAEDNYCHRRQVRVEGGPYWPPIDAEAPAEVCRP